MVETDRRECPGAERIAAFAERSLSASDRAAVAAHLAACDSCRRLLADAAPLLDEPLPVLEDSPVPRVDGAIAVPWWKRGRNRAAAAAALAAASLVLVVSRPELNPFRGPTAHEELVAAVGATRPIEARLTNFAYGPLRSPTRSGADGTRNLAVLASAAQAEERAAENPTVENLHAAGVAQLVRGDLDRAIATLTEVVRREARPTFLNDLAAAYLARASHTDDQPDRSTALALLDRALEGDTPPAEAYYNRALALEALGRSDEALAAWWEFLARDETSGWAEEARRRLADVP